jgi:hypothetical protein
VEDVVVGALDLVEDLGVERQRGAEAVAGGRVHELDAALGAGVPATSPLDLPRQQVADRLVHPAAPQSVAVDAEHVQRLLR